MIIDTKMIMLISEKRSYKKIYNRYVQLAVAQSIIVCLLFWGLVGGEMNLQNVHEHVMNVIVMMVSYTVSEGN